MKLVTSLICCILLSSLFAGCATTCPYESRVQNSTIIHSVFFQLKHEAGSAQETAFFAKADKLVSIPGVENFQVLQEVSPKNPFTFGFSMEFESQADYDGYSTHPDHVRFVQEVWVKEVTNFQEIDYVVIK